MPSKSPLVRDVSVAIEKEIAKHGWTRTEFAGVAGMTPSYVSQILNGDVNLTLQTLERIAKAFGKTIRIDFSGITK